MYHRWSNEMLIETTINVGCFAFGPWLMAYVWRHRAWLGA